MKTTRTPNWTPLPDPIAENEVKLELAWTADPRTTDALKRQAKCCGYASVKDYLLVTIRTGLSQDDHDTILTTDGRMLCGTKVKYDQRGLPQDV
jgi:hypothetical protein